MPLPFAVVQPHHCGTGPQDCEAKLFDWNDLRFLLAVADAGSTLAAARALGVNQSTVQRRLAELEARLGQRLVERLPSGYRLTDLGTAVLPQARAVAEAIDTFAQAVRDEGRSASGVVRVTCPEPIAFRLDQSGLLDRFHAAHPGLKVEFVLSDKYVDLARGEADVALRSGDTDDNVLVGRKIADSLWAIYASRNYVAAHGAPESPADLAKHPLIGFEETMTRHRAVTWLREVAPDATYAARNTSVLGLIYAAKAGVGVAPLPMALGDAEPDLVRVFGPVPELTRPWRILAHPDQRHAPGVEAFFAFILGETEALRPILSG
ncbi:MAG: LysR family transcriptional regulator [Alphaproteobacteria bacterium]|nr:LysR family transcriptional regulator [Alphaproteobacteria bacterium]MBU0804757.1 LysR family transcriptional regulator [Alphaproteobacteria bacterium]MBU0873217.1 LysR family transcriptional regulator [Alphaproteobacteria bacterium]MBU1403302.1 LysR family transcriptional regulator [Alphaproteobacteria bacterium]MBU1589638.1 LysR family transcriptional regulator [Alphaproteobacteria bacterium]